MEGCTKIINSFFIYGYIVNMKLYFKNKSYSLKKRVMRAVKQVERNNVYGGYL